MKKFVIFTFLIVFALAAGIHGCGDGRHKTDPGTTDSDGLSEDVAAVTYRCVNVVNYKDMDFSNIDESDDEYSEGDITKNVSATDAMTTLSSGKNINRLEDETTIIRKCIKNEIKNMRSTGSEYFWSSSGYQMVWILTRAKLSAKPAKNSVEDVTFTSCSQVQSAECLLIE